MTLSNGWKALVIIFLVHFVAYAVLIKENYLLSNLQRERIAQHAFLGDANAGYSDVRAQNYFTRWFVNTGVMAHSFQTMVPTEKQRLNARGMEDMGSNVFPWVQQRVRTWWTMVFQVFARLSYAAMWWPFVLICAIPFIVDALVRRRINATNFALTSPHLQGIAMRAIPVLVVGYFLLTFAPVYIPPQSIPILIVATSALLWLVLAHFVKRG